MTTTNHRDGHDRDLSYWEKKFHLTNVQVQRALEQVNNNPQLLEGFLRKNADVVRNAPGNGHLRMA